MLAQEVIRKKRDGGALAPDEIEFLVDGITDGSVGEGQAAAFAMAVFLRGMDMDERVALTRSMMRSGEVLEWDLPGPVLDKHSTGGVGDKVSLVLAPIVAACGGFVPMISGRGLGHTGGTLDKLDSIPGYSVAPDKEAFRKTVAGAGCAIIGQTGDLAPADGRLYAIRDVTATVESIPLITASILSKKLAAGLDGLVMDVKCGNGAFADGIDMARELAASIVSVAGGAGLATSALVTDMDRVLGRNVGNALEVREAADFLTDPASRDPRLDEVTLELAAGMLALGGLAPSTDAGKGMAREALDSGKAAEVFARMVAALGGPKDFLEKPEKHLEEAPVRFEIVPEKEGVVAAMDTRAVGLAVVELGGGRRLASDAIDHAVGLAGVVGPGGEVGGGKPVATVHARDKDAAGKAARSVLDAVTIGDKAPSESPAIIERAEAGNG